jgi:prophage antirepressor-like protein
MKNINKELEIVLINGEPRVNLSQLAKILGIVHKSALNTIYKYEAKLKQKGELVFKKQGRKKKYFLNEAQFLFFISLSKNTKVAVELKSNSFDNFMKIWVSSRLGLITGSDNPNL